jgi:hypothetical protein
MKRVEDRSTILNVSHLRELCSQTQKPFHIILIRNPLRADMALHRLITKLGLVHLFSPPIPRGGAS